MRDDFIFTPGVWLGEGKITFSASPEFIKFYTKWHITHESEDVMRAVQVVELLQIEEQVTNIFTMADITPTTFTVCLENAVVGQMIGTGLRDERLIAWEFVGQTSLEGFEVYEQQENGDYFLHAEYGTNDDYRTIVEGLIWRKA